MSEAGDSQLDLELELARILNELARKQFKTKFPKISDKRLSFVIAEKKFGWKALRGSGGV